MAGRTLSAHQRRTVARLRTARGQLRAAERLLAEDRPLEAGLQIRAVRAAIWKLAADAVRGHARNGQGGGVGEIWDLLAVAHLALASWERRRSCTRRVTARREPPNLE